MTKKMKDNISSFLTIALVTAVGTVFVKNNMPERSDEQIKVNPAVNPVVAEENLIMTDTISEGEVTEAPAETEVPAETLPEETAPVTEQTTAAEEPLSENDKKAADMLAEMSLEEKVYQLFIVKPEQLSPDEEFLSEYPNTKEELKKYPVGGLIYFERNLSSKEQCEEMIKNVKKRTKTGLFISIDEEGGEIARIGNNPDMETTEFPDTAEIGKSGNPEEAYREGLTIGNDLKKLGFNLDFAPVADVNSNKKNPVIGTRAFSSDPAVVSQMVERSVAGFRESGVICTIKHFPGHGDTDTDSHKEFAETKKNLDELESCELAPFRAGISAGAPVVMAGHIAVPAVTNNDVPASLSKDLITGLLREKLGFNGLVITDSLQMEAITDRYSPDEAAVMALEAGCDIILMPDDLEKAANGISEAVKNGRLTEDRLNDSVMRILKIKIEYGIIS
ncbi:glycoside hydrolase family 3 N-terminal domain-containing protein [Ruminococcus sp. HUN007]|uniref:glycoside hydrolase family 3 protein n=1 Tax=Ruminococcus sp. HUN007 TaxID=1514668 RepID=UPI000678FB27|nr:glycoside hydrolase family 3 N-terminal domain-containing protein [Ruminococcus sp. HUN007]